jgi:2-succinyl-6-hydroxy-2,4-cyclohexadiene-1-carboxylate synthase
MSSTPEGAALQHDAKTEPALLCLHGFGGAPNDFDVLAHHPGLKQQITGWPLLRPPPTPLTEMCILGYSMGARVALEWACSAKSGPGGLILVGATAGIEDSAQRATRRKQEEDWIRQLEDEGTAAFATRWRQNPVIASQSQMPEPYLGEMLKRRTMVPEEELIAQLDTFGQGTYTPRWSALADLDMPVLLVTGEDDEKYGRLADRMSQAFRNATDCIIPGAGHAPHLEQPDAFVDVFQAWLATL